MKKSKIESTKINLLDLIKVSAATEAELVSLILPKIKQPLKSGRIISLDFSGVSKVSFSFLEALITEINLEFPDLDLNQISFDNFDNYLLREYVDELLHGSSETA